MPDLAQKVLEALQQKNIPAVCPVADEIPEGAEMLGYVPEHLRQLCVLCKNMDNAKIAERHRRCVDLFGREEYDHEQVEFMIYNEVDADPNFGGDRLVKGLFDWSLRLHFPQIPTDKFGGARYFLGSNWEVYAANQGRRQPDSVFPFGVIIKK